MPSDLLPMSLLMYRLLMVFQAPTMGCQIAETEVHLAADQANELHAQLMAGFEQLAGSTTVVMEPQLATASLHSAHALCDALIASGVDLPAELCQQAIAWDVPSSDAERHTVGLSFLWLGAHPGPTNAWNFLVSASSVSQARLWAEQVIEAIEVQKLAADGVVWTHLAARVPHATMQGALDDLATQIEAFSPINHAQAQWLRTQVPLAMAQTREARAERALDQLTSRRPRSRP